ncbi:MAG: beta-N-acetylhexosaminidase [Thermodesulfobacteriota bacterium]|nr:beta-N-acetylhexosaminidase [Thermodesulfobacteriota bacterium]
MTINKDSAAFAAGQRLMAGFDGTDLNGDLRLLIDTLHVGGIILFSRNLGAPDEIAALCRDAQAYAADCGLPPLFIAIDQEGGRVARLKEPFTRFPGNPAIKDFQAATQFAAITAGELINTGINMNIAPVLDVADTIGNSIMAERVFPGAPETVAYLGVTVIRGMQDRGVMAVGKHFPGIGRTTTDSHIDRPILKTDTETLLKTDIIPFQSAIAKDVAGLMLSHIIYTGLDRQWPASLSVDIARTLLRDQMGFSGLVLTDDLDMGAIKNHYSITTVINRIMAADIDIALICHKGPDRETAFEEMARHIRSAPAQRARSNAALNRILALKTRYLNYSLSAKTPQSGVSRFQGT